MSLGDQQIKEILARGNYVTSDDLVRAEEYSKIHHSSLTDFLLAQGIISQNLLGQAIAESLVVPFVDLVTHQPTQEQVFQIPQLLARTYSTVLCQEDAGSVTIATENPKQPQLVANLQALFPNKKINLAYALPEAIEAAFMHYHKPLETRFSEIIKKEERVAPEIIDEILKDAIAFRASDIHFEPQEKEVVIRFRVDGVMAEAGRIAKDYYENIVNRIKVASRLRIDEHFSAQDGAMRYVHEEMVIDLRISVVPTLDGEKIAIRLLSQYVRDLTLSNLGLSAQHEKLLSQATAKPFGMILVTGPTGSGKTTTLYALIKILNTPAVNIMTIEDPVEYKILGINQIQVSAATNLTFSQGLRSIVRQDPDVILVGEIRDEDTAEIAVNAALTGHLLFSTFHANDAATSIPRLLDMGVEPFLLASTLEVIIAQRLVRRICESCRYSSILGAQERDSLFPNARNYFPLDSTTIYKSKGCKICNQTGFHGRTAIFEFITVTPPMREQMLQNPSARQVWQLARSEGSRSLFEDGIDKVKNGVTTLEELLRVASPDVYT